MSRSVVTLDVMHASLQFSDSRKQHQEDVTKIFDRAANRKVDWITGTEAGPGAKDIEEKIFAAGQEFGYKVWVPQLQPRSKPGWATDSWVAVRREIVVPKTFRKGWIPVIEGSNHIYEQQGLSPNGRPRWGPKGLVHVSFDCEKDGQRIGEINVAAAHYLVRKAKQEPLNRKLAEAAGAWARDVGKGRALAFYGGDQNLPDDRVDTFFGAPLTSLWDELNKHPKTGTGLGNIDLIASYDKDGRVTGKYCRALSGKRFFLNTDHFLVEGGFDVVSLGEAA